MININGTIVSTIEQLEALIVNESEDNKTYFRNQFNGFDPPPVIDDSKDIRIYDFIPYKNKYSKLEPPVDYDFITGLTTKLHRKSIIVKGECTSEEYYESFNGTTYTRLIVKEESLFVRDAIGFPISKTVTISWYKNNGESHPTKKTWVKYYSDIEKISEGKTRRGNLVDALQRPCIGLISIALTGSQTPTFSVILQGRAFLAEYKDELENFISSSNKDVLDCFSNPLNANYPTTTKYSWIDSMTPYGITIRQFLINSLTI